MPPSKVTAFGAALMAAAFGASGCSMFHAGMAQAPMLSALADDDTGSAQRIIDDSIGVERGEQPKKLHGFTALMLADRANVRLESGLYHQATDDYRAADKALDLKDMELDDIMRHTGMPSMMRHAFHLGWLAGINYPYVPRLHERLMMNALAMLAYLDLGDDENARVEARRLDVMVDFARRTLPSSPALGTRVFSGILAGFAFDRGDQPDDALRAYRDAVTAATVDVSPLVTKIPAAPRGEILVVIAYGLVPHPDVDAVPTTNAATPGWAVPPADAGKPIPIRDYPLTNGADDEETPTIVVDGTNERGVEVLDLSDVVKADWALGKKETGQVTTPLSWAALPSRYVLARIPVSSGTHHVKLAVRNVPLEKNVLVPPGSYATVSLVVMR